LDSDPGREYAKTILANIQSLYSQRGGIGGSPPEREMRDILACYAERDRLRALLTMFVEAIDDYEEPDRDATTREWCGRFSTYLRGCVVGQFTLMPEEWAQLQEFTEQTND